VLEITDNSPETLPDCDALITNIPNHLLMIKHADCQAALFYDPVQRAIGAVHSGWKGTVQNIYKATLEAMSNRYGSNPKDILVGISRSLGPTASQFINYKTELPEQFWSYRTDGDLFDFWKITTDQLLEAGITQQHIELAKICTNTNSNDCFSYRRQQTTGRHGTAIAII
jgi:YfiH family protein